MAGAGMPRVDNQVARMSEAKCGIIVDQPSRCPGCRLGHPGYLLLEPECGRSATTGCILLWLEINTPIKIP
jgi:hypothetical protein